MTIVVSLFTRSVIRRVPYDTKYNIQCSYEWNNWVWETTNWSYVNITNHSRWIYVVYLKLMKKNWKISTWNWLDLEILGSWTLMSKNLPKHWYVVRCGFKDGHQEDVCFDIGLRAQNLKTILTSNVNTIGKEGGMWPYNEYEKFTLIMSEVSIYKLHNLWGEWLQPRIGFIECQSHVS
jgi:hypothetical protein